MFYLTNLPTKNQVTKCSYKPYMDFLWVWKEHVLVAFDSLLANDRQFLGPVRCKCEGGTHGSTTSCFKQWTELPWWKFGIRKVTIHIPGCISFFSWEMHASKSRGELNFNFKWGFPYYTSSLGFVVLVVTSYNFSPRFFFEGPTLRELRLLVWGV